jgi:hypothetical protein
MPKWVNKAQNGNNEPKKCSTKVGLAALLHIIAQIKFRVANSNGSPLLAP